MSDFLDRLVARTRAPQFTIRPLLPTAFEASDTHADVSSGIEAMEETREISAPPVKVRAEHPHPHDAATTDATEPKPGTARPPGIEAKTEIEAPPRSAPAELPRPAPPTPDEIPHAQPRPVEQEPGPIAAAIEPSPQRQPHEIGIHGIFMPVAAPVESESDALAPAPVAAPHSKSDAALAPTPGARPQTPVPAPPRATPRTRRVVASGEIAPRPAGPHEEAAAAAAPPEVHISIGRVEIRAASPTPSQPAPPAAAAPKLTLDDFLKRHAGASR